MTDTHPFIVATWIDSDAPCPAFAKGWAEWLTRFVHGCAYPEPDPSGSHTFGQTHTRSDARASFIPFPAGMDATRAKEAAAFIEALTYKSWRQRIIHVPRDMVDPHRTVQIAAIRVCESCLTCEPAVAVQMVACSRCGARRGVTDTAVSAGHFDYDAVEPILRQAAGGETSPWNATRATTTLCESHGRCGIGTSGYDFHLIAPTWGAPDTPRFASLGPDHGILLLSTDVLHEEPGSSPLDDLHGWFHLQEEFLEPIFHHLSVQSMSELYAAHKFSHDGVPWMGRFLPKGLSPVLVDGILRLLRGVVYGMHIAVAIPEPELDRYRRSPIVTWLACRTRTCGLRGNLIVGDWRRCMECRKPLRKVLRVPGNDYDTSAMDRDAVIAKHLTPAFATFLHVRGFTAASRSSSALRAAAQRRNPRVTGPA